MLFLSKLRVDCRFSNLPLTYVYPNWLGYFAIVGLVYTPVLGV